MSNDNRKITKSVVDNLKPDSLVWDTELRGFYVRRQKHDKVYGIKTRLYGRQRWFTIGKHGVWTPQKARQQARATLVMVDKGEDPSQASREHRQSQSIKEHFANFVAIHGPKLRPRTLQQYKWQFRKFIEPKFGNRKLHEISKRDVARLHSEHGGNPRQANHIIAELRALINWTMKSGSVDLAENPCSGIAPYPEPKRQRYLSLAELGRLGKTLNEAEAQEGENRFALAALRLLILTGARLSEILTLKWSYINFDHRVILLPESKTGHKAIRLTEKAITILESMPKIQNNPYVIVGKKDGSHLVNLQKPWQRIRRSAKLDDVRIHDLRHTYASMAVMSDISLPLVGELLGQGQLSMTERYAHLADDPIAAAAEIAAERIAETMSGNRSTRDLQKLKHVEPHC